MPPLQYALVGCGVVAAKHIKAALFHRRDISLAALVDLRPEAPAALERAAGLHKGQLAAIPFYQDIQRMLDEKRPDLVAITTSSGTHYALARAAIAAGAHVLVEKPITMSLREADELIAAAQEKQVRIAVGHIYRFFPLVQQLQADLRAGAFGRLLHGAVTVRWGHDQAYYDQAAWRGTWTMDGGALMNQSIHALDLMAWLLGSPVAEISGWIAQQGHRMEAEDFGLAMLRLQDGCFCQVVGTTCGDPRRKEASFTVIGTRGEIRCGLYRGKPTVRITDERGRNKTLAYLCRYLRTEIGRDGWRALSQLANPHSGLYADLIRAIRDKRPPLADGQSGRQAVELVLAIYRSALENKPAALPLPDFQIQSMAGFFGHPGDQA